MRTIHSITTDITTTTQALDSLQRHLRALAKYEHLSPLRAAKARASLTEERGGLQEALAALLAEHAQTLRAADVLTRAILAAVRDNCLASERRAEVRLFRLLDGAPLDLPTLSTVTDAGERYVRASLWAEEAPVGQETSEAVEAWLAARERAQEERRQMGVAA